MRSRLALLPLVAATAALALAGCTINLTTSPERVEELALGALAEQTGISPESLDCGEDSIPLVVGTEVPCVAVVDGEERDATVTITSVEDGRFSIDVTIAAAGGPAPEPTPETLMIPRQDLADQAVTALEPQYGSTPVVICAGNDVPLVVGTEIECVVRVPATGAEGIGTIVITRVEGTAYSIDINVVDA